jgi:hypothetical protein
MESDARFYRRRVNEELAAAGRAVTEAARERRTILANLFLERLKASEARSASIECVSHAIEAGEASIFEWR